MKKIKKKHFKVLNIAIICNVGRLEIMVGIDALYGCLVWMVGKDGW